jgi:hypothetical protein
MIWIGGALFALNTYMYLVGPFVSINVFFAAKSRPSPPRSPIMSRASKFPSWQTSWAIKCNESCCQVTCDVPSDV